MRRILSSIVFSVCITALLCSAHVSAKEIRGFYVETRTCQVYTGPCFANAEVGLAGHDAVMAWRIAKGDFQGVDLAGMNVVVVINASDTLGFQGINSAKKVKSVILVDDRASAVQRDALIQFAKQHSGKAGQTVVRVDSMPIEMSLDTTTLKADLQAGKAVRLRTRKARPDDCICSNESAYYPPLAKVENFVPGVTIEGSFNGRGLGCRWSTPQSRSAYMATFAY